MIDMVKKGLSKCSNSKIMGNREEDLIHLDSLILDSTQKMRMKNKKSK